MEDSSMLIRIMTIKDHAQVVALWSNTKGIGTGDGDNKKEINSYLKRNPGLSFVAVSEKRIIGAVLCGHDGRRGYIHHLAVAPDFRSKGIGTSLVNACLYGLNALEIAKCNIFVYKSNISGRKFWKKSGWGTRTDLLVLQKKIS